MKKMMVVKKRQGNTMICMIQVVSFPDLIQHVYYLQYNMQYVPKVICAGVGFGSGTETVIRVNVKWM